MIKVEVYFNLHKRVFSVRSCKTGRVIHHAKDVHINQPQFVVREGGRQRVLRERKKNVHAFVRGYTTRHDDEPELLTDVVYNPYKYDSFVDWKTETPLDKGLRAWMGINELGIPWIQAEGVQ